MAKTFIFPWVLGATLRVLWIPFFVGSDFEDAEDADVGSDFPPPWNCHWKPWWETWDDLYRGAYNPFTSYILRTKDIPVTKKARWWQLKYFCIFTPIYLGKIFTHFDLRIFFRWVGSTTNQGLLQRDKMSPHGDGVTTWGIFSVGIFFFSQYELSGFFL